MAESTHSTHSKAVWDNQRFAKATSDIEGVTGNFAQQMLAQAGLRDYPKDAPLVVFDSACGGGILTLRLQAVLQDRPQDTFEVTDGDLADTMVELATQRVQAEGWKNTHVTKINAENTELPDDHFTHVFTNFGIMTFANPSAALSEYHRILRPNGVCGFSTWASIPWLDDMKTAMASVTDLPELPAHMDVANIFSDQKIWHDAAAVREFVARHDFVDVESNLVRAVSVLDDPVQLDAVLKPPLTLMMRFFWTQEQRDVHDTPATYARILAWFVERLRQGGPMEWHWSAVVTICRKPGRK